MNYIKKFEELNFDSAIFSTSVNNLTNYYSCKECEQLSKEFNRQLKECPNCHSNDLVSVDIDVFYKKLEDKLGKEYYDKIQQVKSQEENEMSDMTLFTKPLRESINDKNGLKHWASKFLSLLVSPITVPLVANLSTENKIKLFERIIFESYIEEKAEYRILDEIKYDIEKPSELNKIRKRLRMISNKYKKYPTLDTYLKAIFKTFKIVNILNFRNREDVDYACEKIKDFFIFEKMDESIGENEWIEWCVKSNLYYDGIIKRKVEFGIYTKNSVIIFTKRKNNPDSPRMQYPMDEEELEENDMEYGEYDYQEDYQEPDYQEPDDDDELARLMGW